MDIWKDLPENSILHRVRRGSKTGIQSVFQSRWQNQQASEFKGGSSKANLTLHRRHQNLRRWHNEGA